MANKPLRDRIRLDVATAVDDMISIDDCTDHIVDNIMSPEDRAIILHLIDSRIKYWNAMTISFPHAKVSHDKLVVELEGVISRL